MPRTYVLVIAAVLLAPAACQKPDPSSVHYGYHPPESQKFLDCYDKISDDMGEEDVNAILAGYPQQKSAYDNPANESSVRVFETQKAANKEDQSENKAAAAPDRQEHSLDWPLFRGDSSRTAVGVGRGPLLTPTWSRITLGDQLANGDPDVERFLYEKTRRVLEAALHKQAQTGKPLARSCKRF